MSMRPIQLNVIDLPKADYTGGPSSLCPGCGHDQISNVIIQAAWESKCAKRCFRIRSARLPVACLCLCQMDKTWARK